MASYANVTTLYVSEKYGSDTNLGIHFENDRIMNGPLKTIARALVLIGDMRRAEYRQPITIALMDEEYFFSSPLPLEYPRGKGHHYHNAPMLSDVTFAPFLRERVLFSGGRRIEGWAEDTYNGTPCLSVHLPEVEEGKWRFTELYVGGLPAKKTRRPAEGFFYPEAVENDIGGYHNPSRWFIAEEGDIPVGVRNVEDATINFCHFWVDEHSRIAKYEPDTRKVYFDGRTRMTISAARNTAAAMPYYIENLSEAFHHPGEWYLDRPTGMLYYAPKEGETAENITVYAPVATSIVDIKGDGEGGCPMRGIRFKDIDFAYTEPSLEVFLETAQPDGSKAMERVVADGQCSPTLRGVINTEYAVGVAVEDCRFYAYGSHAVYFGKGTSDSRVVGCHAMAGAGGGVSIQGGAITDPEYTHTHHNVVTDSVFEMLGLRFFSASGVLITHAYSNEISHNTIRNLYYSGICLGWRWGYFDTIGRDNLILKNHIYDLGKGVLSDMGGVYTLGAQPGTRVEGNLIHDVKSRNYGGWGLYSDEGSAYITFADNICYNCSSNCYHQNYGTMNTVRNNIFASAGNALVQFTRREGHEGLLFSHNIFLPDEGKPVYGNATACGCSSDNNLIWQTGGKAPLLMLWEGKELTLNEVRTSLDFDRSSVVASPRFKDRARFVLRADSPALAIGFKPIDISDVGPRGKLKNL